MRRYRVLYEVAARMDRRLDIAPAVGFLAVGLSFGLSSSSPRLPYSAHALVASPRNRIGNLIRFTPCKAGCGAKAVENGELSRFSIRFGYRFNLS